MGFNFRRAAPPQGRRHFGGEVVHVHAEGGLGVRRDVFPGVDGLLERHRRVAGWWAVHCRVAHVHDLRARRGQWRELQPGGDQSGTYGPGVG